VDPFSDLATCRVSLSCAETMGQRVYEPGVEASSMSNAVGKTDRDRTGYHLKALQEIRNSLRPFATENGSSQTLTLPTIQKDGNVSYQQHLFQSFTSSGVQSGGYSEVKNQITNAKVMSE
jgi:hypothetical protein